MSCGGSNLQFPIITKITHFAKKLSQSNCIIGSGSNFECWTGTKIKISNELHLKNIPEEFLYTW